MLNGAGPKAGKDLNFTPGRVAVVRGIYQIFTPWTMTVGKGEVSVKDAARLLGIAADAVYNWIRRGQVPARMAPSGRWCIPWDAETQQTTGRRSRAVSAPTEPACRGKPMMSSRRQAQRGRQTTPCAAMTLLRALPADSSSR